MIGYIDHTHHAGGKIRCDHPPKGEVGFKWADCTGIDATNVGHGTRVRFSIARIDGIDRAVGIRRDLGK